MFIKKLIVQEGMNIVQDVFSRVNLVYSKRNSRGKSTYLRFLFYALGYPIPSMKGVNYSYVNTELHIAIEDRDARIIRTEKMISVQVDDEKDPVLFALPFEHQAFLAYLFNCDKINVLNNILGIIYIDQEKGWTLLNRGVVIGKIKFNIEELIAGLADIECDDLLEKVKILQQEETKYKAMLSIGDLSEEVYANNGEIFLQDIEKELLSSISMIELQIRDLKKEINDLEFAVNREEQLMKFIEDMHLCVKHNDEIIEVTKDNIQYGAYPIEYLRARKGILCSQLSRLSKARSNLKNKLEDYYLKNTEISLLNGDTQQTIINRQLSQFNCDKDTVNKLLAQAQVELKKVRIQIKNLLKKDNKFISKIFSYVKAYSKDLQIDDIVDERNEYIFTTDLKSLSGAHLQKLVLAFKIAFLKVIEEVLNTKLIFVLDSPRGRELDKENFDLIMELIGRELKENQVFVASIYDDFSYTQKIELQTKATESRSVTLV